MRELVHEGSSSLERHVQKYASLLTGDPDIEMQGPPPLITEDIQRTPPYLSQSDVRGRKVTGILWGWCGRRRVEVTFSQIQMLSSAKKALIPTSVYDASLLSKPYERPRAFTPIGRP